MMEPDKIDLIKKVMAAHIDAERGFINMEMLFGHGFKESDFYEVVSTALDLATAATSMFVGDKWQWIHWYIASGYGKKPIVAKGREIVTVDDLIWLIDEYGKGGNDGRI